MKYMDTLNKLDIDLDKNGKPKNFVTDDGNVYILGNFDSTISTNVVPIMLTLINSLSTEKNPTINIYINSYGGEAKELFSLLSIIEMAKQQGIKIVTYVLGCAYSAGSLLAVFGDERYMSRYADHLLHLGSSGCSFTTFEQLKRETENNIKHFNKILDIYAAHTKIPKKKLSEMLKDDKLYLDPKQCLEYGICDFII